MSQTYKMSGSHNSVVIHFAIFYVIDISFNDSVLNDGVVCMYVQC